MRDGLLSLVSLREQISRVEYEALVAEVDSLNIAQKKRKEKTNFVL